MKSFIILFVFIIMTLLQHGAVSRFEFISPNNIEAISFPAERIRIRDDPFASSAAPADMHIVCAWEDSCHAMKSRYKDEMEMYCHINIPEVYIMTSTVNCETIKKSDASDEVALVVQNSCHVEVFLNDRPTNVPLWNPLKRSDHSRYNITMSEFKHRFSYQIARYATITEAFVLVPSVEMLGSWMKSYTRRLQCSHIEEQIIPIINNFVDTTLPMYFMSHHWGISILHHIVQGLITFTEMVGFAQHMMIELIPPFNFANSDTPHLFFALGCVGAGLIIYLLAKLLWFLLQCTIKCAITTFYNIVGMVKFILKAIVYAVIAGVVLYYVSIFLH